jgi:hypothetical protein
MSWRGADGDWVYWSLCPGILYGIGGIMGFMKDLFEHIASYSNAVSSTKEIGEQHSWNANEHSFNLFEPNEFTF